MYFHDFSFKWGFESQFGSWAQWGSISGGNGRALGIKRRPPPAPPCEQSVEGSPFHERHRTEHHRNARPCYSSTAVDFHRPPSLIRGCLCIYLSKLRILLCEISFFDPNMLALFLPTRNIAFGCVFTRKEEKERRCPNYCNPNFVQCKFSTFVFNIFPFLCFTQS